MINKINLKSVSIPAMIILSLMLLSLGCTTPVKVGVPDDHTDIIEGVGHRDGSDNPLSAESDCTSCHQQDLRGGATVIEGATQYAPSCFQCHGNEWDDENQRAKK